MRGWLGLAGTAAVASLPDVLALVGVGLTAYGAARIYEPAGFIIGGIFLLVVGLIGVVRRG